MTVDVWVCIALVFAFSALFYCIGHRHGYCDGQTDIYEAAGRNKAKASE